MNMMGWSTWATVPEDIPHAAPYASPGGLRLWKWHSRTDVYVATEDVEVLAIIASALSDAYS